MLTARQWHRILGVAALGVVGFSMGGCSGNSTTGFQTVFSVAGNWTFTTTITALTAGPTVPPFLLPTVGSTTTGTLALTQAVRTIDGSGTNTGTGVIFPLTGEISQRTVTLTSTGTSPGCGAVRVDLALILNEAGTQMTGTTTSQTGSCFSSTTTFTANRVL